MEYPLYNQEGQNIGTVNLPENIFGLNMNQDLLHQVVTSQMSNQRQVLAHTKGRGEVRGGGKKPWRQKGTGRARHGSIRSPIWKGGGVTFGPTKERNFKKKINRKMVRKALFVALSSKAKDKQLFVIDDMKLQNPKTKEMAKVFSNFRDLLGLSAQAGKKPNVLLIMPIGNENVKRAVKNLPYFSAVEAKDLNPLEILAHKQLVLVKDSIGVLSRLLRNRGSSIPSESGEKKLKS